MRIKLHTVLVEDQTRALEFYTGVLGFVTRDDLRVGDYRWLTVVSPEEPHGAALSLEPFVHPSARAAQRALLDQGIPSTALEVDDVEAEFLRLTGLGVAFTTPPTRAGEVTLAVFDDTCGNLIQLYQPARAAPPA